MKKRILFLFLLFSNFAAFSQVYNAEKKHLEQLFTTDSRIRAKFFSTMRNVGGYEGVTLRVDNLTDKLLYVEIRLYITDNCGKVTTYKIKETIRANDHIGGNTWMGGSEQINYDSPCESTKYAEWQYSKIKSVAIDVDKISESPGTGGSGTGGSGTGTGGTGSGASPPPASGNNCPCAVISSTCPVQGMAISNGPSMNCIQLRWINQATIQHNPISGETKTNNPPDQFVLSYKRAADRDWKEFRISNYQMGYNLTALDPCTAYEVKLQRDCGNNMRSDYSGTLQFTTGCPSPGSVKADQISSTSAHIGSMFSPGLNACSAQRPTYTIHVEYAAPGGSWQTVISNPGAGSSMLYNLQPQTSYRVRVRFEYKTGIFSKYSNEILFTTKP